MSDNMSDIDSERDESSSSEEPEEVIRSRVPALSVTRERRANAGSKMASLIQNYAALTESTDNDNEFYTTAYGGFDEDAEDEEFDDKQEEADDELDSDFDAEEAEEAVDADVADDQEEGGRKRVSRKAKETYEISADRRKAAEKRQAPKPKPKAKAKLPAAAVAKKPADLVTRSVVEEFLGKRNLRKRKPVVRDEEDEPPVKKSSSARKRSRKSKVEDDKKVWSQEELLQEARETERENLASLQKYQLLELERNEAKKRAKKSSREIAGPFIRFISTSMPVVAADQSDQRDEDDVKDSSDALLVADESAKAAAKTERTFIVFSDDNVMSQAFPCNRPHGRRRQNPADIKRGAAICPISNLKARYFDPVTQMPFASSTTFRALREAYCNQLQLYYGNLNSTSSSPAAAEADAATLPKSLVKKKDELRVWLDWKRSQRRPSTS